MKTSIDNLGFALAFNAIVLWVGLPLFRQPVFATPPLPHSSPQGENTYIVAHEIWSDLWDYPFVLGASGIVLVGEVDTGNWIVHLTEYDEVTGGSAIGVGFFQDIEWVNVFEQQVAGGWQTMFAVRGILTGTTGIAHHIKGVVMRLETTDPSGHPIQTDSLLPLEILANAPAHIVPTVSRRSSSTSEAASGPHSGPSGGSDGEPDVATTRTMELEGLGQKRQVNVTGNCWDSFSNPNQTCDGAWSACRDCCWDDFVNAAGFCGWTAAGCVAAAVGLCIPAGVFWWACFAALAAACLLYELACLLNALHNHDNCKIACNDARVQCDPDWDPPTCIEHGEGPIVTCE